jgi:hypothetical protein
MQRRGHASHDIEFRLGRYAELGRYEFDGGYVEQHGRYERERRRKHGRLELDGW